MIDLSVSHYQVKVTIQGGSYEPPDEMIQGFKPIGNEMGCMRTVHLHGNRECRDLSWLLGWHVGEIQAAIIQAIKEEEEL